MRSLTERPSASDISVTLIRFGRKRRLVLMFEWLTVWPDRGPFPVSSQRRDMSKSLDQVVRAGHAGDGKNGPFRGTRTYKVTAQGRQVRNPSRFRATSAGHSPSKTGVNALVPRRNTDS